MAAMEKTLGKPQAKEPLIPVSKRFLDDRLNLAVAGSELGLAELKGLRELFRLPQFVSAGLSPLGGEESLGRDAWDEQYDRVVKQLGMGTAVVPLDALTPEEEDKDGG